MHPFLFFFFQQVPSVATPGQEVEKKVMSTDPLTELINQFSAFLPKFIGAMIILLIGWMAARFVRKILSKLLAKIGVDMFGEMLNDIEIVQKSGMLVRISDVLARVVYYVMMLFFIIAATDAMGIQAITQLVTDALNYLPSLFSAAAIFLMGLFLADMVKGLVLTVCKSIGLSSADLVSSVVFYFLFVTVSVSALAQAKINTDFISSNLTVIVGSVALAFALGYGFASRDLMANYLAGYYNRNKIRVGDDIRIIGVRGKVVMIDATSLFLQTPERAIVIPLSKLASEKVEVFYPEPQKEDLLEPGNSV
jgi:hypothetical protein